MYPRVLREKHDKPSKLVESWNIKRIPLLKHGNTGTMPITLLMMSRSLQGRFGEIMIKLPGDLCNLNLAMYNLVLGTLDN
jgi:hypothetical protein